MAEEIKPNKEEGVFNQSDQSGIILELKYNVAGRLDRELKYAVADKIIKKLEYAIANKYQVSLIKKRRQTVKNKESFLKYWENSMGVVTMTCRKVKIDKSTFYYWMKKDPVFAKEINKLVDDRNNIAEDLLWGRITVKKDGACIRYYLDRKHPDYKPTMKNEIFAGKITLEEIIDDDEDELNRKHEKKKIKQMADREAPQDKKQEGEKSPVQIEHGPAVVLEKEDAPKPDTESPAKGTE